ncbi:MAG: aldehyde dehydrogenase PuuC [Gammaproteobacteria bacterium HGW-Gammaproteobacteria-2]|jgi:gamma-glutamyl-gamma-aminobutyraldehyde dehydrogenase|nr:MAG: aldehyde dehydrogenase PuuC [Gammaproteobacteria bacterium HGW-Gammaproteobacteria-2]
MSTANTRPTSREQWLARAAALSIRSQAFIDGNYMDAASGQTFDCISPIDGRVIAAIAQCEAEDVERAVRASRRAFDDGRWSATAPVHRKKVLIRFAQLLDSHREELALLETLDMGKPISDALSVDLAASVRCMSWTGEAIDKVYDEVAPTGRDELGLVTREPLGIVAAIVPWNFPLLMAIWKIAPALAMGNSVILKPSEKSPLSALRIAELAIEAGIPPGVFNVLPGFGKGAGEPLALHMDVDGIVFTGSTAVGKHLLQCAGRSNMKRAFMECGGKSPNIIFADAPDLAEAARAAAGAIFYNQGEVCTAASRLLVDRAIKDEFIAEVVAAGRKLQPRHPLDADAPMGAMVDESHLQRVLGYIEQGQSEGATLALGGKRVMTETGGCYIEPTIFDGVGHDMTIAREEIFGPVLSTIAFTDEAEALRIANDSPFGLAAAVWTRDINRAHRVARKLRAGSVWVNYWDGGDMTAPFGGFKQSGNGRDKSLHAFDKYTELKATWIKLAP